MNHYNNLPLHSNIAHRLVIEPAVLRSGAIHQKPVRLTTMRISAAARALRQLVLRAVRAAISQ